MVTIVNLDNLNFEKEIGQKGIGLVDFWADWCNPCQSIKPIIKELANHYRGKIKFFSLNVEKNPQIAQKYQIMSIPTFLIFNDGKVVGQITGITSKESFIKKLNSLL